MICENTEVALEDVMNIDMSSSMQLLATFIARFSGPSTHRIKIKYCGLCESVCSHMGILTIRKNSPPCFIILDTLLQWMSPKVFFLFLLSRSRLTCFRYQGPMISIWHVSEQSSSCWIVYNFVRSILPILDMPFVK
jgi:hypothetical protein